MAEAKDRRVKVETPVGLIVLAVTIGLVVLGGILYAVWVSGAQVTEARMRGVVIAKEFVPAPEEQVTIGEQGLSTSERAGEYKLTVNVRQANGTDEPYTVWLDKTRYDAVEVGDSFDVGPYLVR